MKGCPICGVEIFRHKLMCAPHWRLVPAPLRDEVNAKWDEYRRALRLRDRELLLKLGPELREAQQAAIDAVRERLNSKEEA